MTMRGGDDEKMNILRGFIHEPVRCSGRDGTPFLRQEGDVLPGHFECGPAGEHKEELMRFFVRVPDLRSTGGDTLLDDTQVWK